MTSWANLAACAEEPLDWFYPEGPMTEREDRTNKAKAVCAVCPVRIQCAIECWRLDWRFGVWAGTTPEERAVIAREVGLRADVPDAARMAEAVARTCAVTIKGGVQGRLEGIAS